ncbi:MAG: hypothetical protein CSB33_03190 [Desulfobacterales bacterium]|nr:MAG: hypothetical protein CSB33_03190 [Desulfobacterales bacterium]
MKTRLLPVIKEQGFSLLELVVAVGIFMFILLPVLGVFSTSRESYVVQDSISVMQQEARAAMLFLERDIRMAGAGVKGMDTPTGRVYGIEFDNAGGPGGSDVLRIVYQNPENSPCDDGGSPGGYNYCDQLPALSTAANNISDGDPVVILTTGFTGAWTSGCYCDGTTYTSDYNGQGLEIQLRSPDGTASAVFRVSQLVGGSNQFLAVPYDGGSGTTTANVVSSFGLGSNITFYNDVLAPTIRYYINAKGVLVRDETGGGGPQPLAENVEDLQFAIFGDFDNDKKLDLTTKPCAANGDCINSVDLRGDDGNTADDNKLDDIAVVRVSILVRTDREYKELVAEARPAVEDNNPGGSPDHFRRRLLTQDIKVRNMGN